jgi:2',3'-cyclic-nucleotide 2'-phosphodiesterase (5'-nucleotidase family)
MKQNNLKCFILLFLSNFKAEAGKNDLKLVILHLNDFHAHIEQTTENLTRCRPGSCNSNLSCSTDSLTTDNWKSDQMSARLVLFKFWLVLLTLWPSRNSLKFDKKTQNIIHEFIKSNTYSVVSFTVKRKRQFILPKQLLIHFDFNILEDNEKQLCFGGIGRVLSKINEIRNQDPNHTLVLHAGDFYQGTIWWEWFPNSIALSGTKQLIILLWNCTPRNVIKVNVISCFLWSDCIGRSYLMNITVHYDIKTVK